MFVVLIETWPSQARMVLISTPARRRCVAVVCRLFRDRNRRHYAGLRTIPGEVDFEPIGSSLTNIFPA
jgi:hypothetical protein